MNPPETENILHKCSCNLVANLKQKLSERISGRRRPPEARSPQNTPPPKKKPLQVPGEETSADWAMTTSTLGEALLSERGGVPAICLNVELKKTKRKAPGSRAEPDF